MVTNILNKIVGGEDTSTSSGSDASLISQSSLINDVAGTCPKCKQEMGSAIIADNSSVYHCEKCRVSSPLKDFA